MVPAGSELPRRFELGPPPRNDRDLSDSLPSSRAQAPAGGIALAFVGYISENITPSRTSRQPSSSTSGPTRAIASRVELA